MKKGNRVAVESSPGASLYPVGAEARAQFRHQSLLMDYQELSKETEAKKKKLRKAHQNKLKLLAEVKFLRRKYESFSKNPSNSTLYRLKKRPQNMLPHLIGNAQPLKPIIQSEVSTADNIHFRSEASIPSSTSAGIDLNQASFLSGNEMEEFQVNWEPLNIDNSNKRALEGDALSTDLKLSICRDVGKGSSRTKKKKITWQDQVALKV